MAFHPPDRRPAPARPLRAPRPEHAHARPDPGAVRRRHRGDRADRRYRLLVASVDWPEHRPQPCPPHRPVRVHDHRKVLGGPRVALAGADVRRRSALGYLGLFLAPSRSASRRGARLPPAPLRRFGEIRRSRFRSRRPCSARRTGARGRRCSPCSSPRSSSRSCLRPGEAGAARCGASRRSRCSGPTCTVATLSASWSWGCSPRRSGGTAETRGPRRATSPSGRQRVPRRRRQPVHYKLWLYPLTYFVGGNSSLAAVDEWQSPTSMNCEISLSPSSSSSRIAFGGYGRRFDSWRTPLLAVFGLMALESLRHQPLFAIAWAPGLGPALPERWPWWRATRNRPAPRPLN